MNGQFNRKTMIFKAIYSNYDTICGQPKLNSQLFTTWGWGDRFPTYLLYPRHFGQNRFFQKGNSMNDTRNLNNPPDEQVRDILAGMKRVAVVGLSAKEDRASHGIARFLVGQGLDVVGVNPMLKEDVFGIKVYASLAEVPGQIDVVDVFRRSETVPPVVNEAIAMKAGMIWMQEEVVHEEAAAKARAAGLVVIQDRCLYKEWLRLMNG